MRKSTPSFEKPKRVLLGSGALGLALLVSGSVFMHRLLFTPDPRGPSPLFLLELLSPAAILLGLVILARGIAGEERAFSGRNLFTAGLLMVALGIYPWAYTPLLIRDRGMEGSGMLGTFLFLFLGLPGIAAVIIGYRLKKKQTPPAAAESEKGRKMVY